MLLNLGFNFVFEDLVEWLCTVVKSFKVTLKVYWLKTMYKFEHKNS